MDNDPALIDQITRNVVQQLSTINTSNANKKEAKIKAIDMALQMKTQPYFDYKTNQMVVVDFDIVGQAELIYQWLIKDL